MSNKRQVTSRGSRAVFSNEKPCASFFVLRSESGMASILITMITLVVISLIVLGFATISRREVNNTTSQQLSQQAFYAAESAVNDAREVINDAVNTGQPIPEKDNCTTNAPGGGSYPSAGSNGVVLDAAHNVSYTCLLVDATPSDLSYDGVSDSQSKVVQVTAAKSTDNISSINVSWTTANLPSGATNPANDCKGSLVNSFDPATTWKCGYGILREDLVPTTGSLSNLSANTVTGFFEPQNTPNPNSTLDYAAGKGKPNLLAATCSSGAGNAYNGHVPGPNSGPNDSGCLAVINNLSCAAAPCNSFTLRLMSLYQISNVLVTAYDSSGKAVPTAGQVVVDATGDANGVLRRIQVRLPVSAKSGTVPAYTIQSNGAVCKRYQVTPNYFSIGNIINPDGSNPMCNSGYSTGTPSAGG